MFKIIVLGIVLAFVIWLYCVYKNLINRKNSVREALSGIDVQLKKRYDLLPNVLFMANKFMEHERSLIEDITKLRTQALKLRADFDNLSDKLKLDDEINSKMKQLMVSVENYPQLKSDNTMVQAMQTYNEVEEHIAAARRFYNTAVKELNNAIETWPSSGMAKSMGIKSELPYFEDITNIQREPIDAKSYFGDN